MEESAPEPWIAGLSATTHPDHHEPGKCPWAWFERADHDSGSIPRGGRLLLRFGAGDPETDRAGDRV